MGRSKLRKGSKPQGLTVTPDEALNAADPLVRQVTARAAAAVVSADPTVSICTLTRNRQGFLPLLQACVASQTYPHHLIEWVILDDSDNGEPAFVPDPELDVRVKQIVLPQTLILGHKRNVSHQHCEGEIIVYMDDDDYYPPQRIRHAVDRLQETGHLVAGSTILPIYFTDTGQAWVAGPYRENHATANTFAFRRELLDTTRYQDEATHAEEKAFLKDYQIPMAQLDCAQTILCMGHSGNTFDKRKLIQGGQNPRMRKLADLPVEFILPTVLESYGAVHRLHGRTMSPVKVSSPPKKNVRPSVEAWYINLDKDRERRAFIESQYLRLPKQVALHRVAAITPENLNGIPEYSYLRLLDRLRQIQHCVVLSHLKAIESFVNTSQATHALIMEDDIDLGCMEHWGFDIIDVAERMHSGHGILQLNVIWSAAIDGQQVRFLVPQKMHCHPRSEKEYSTAAYLIDRRTASEILAFLKPAGKDFFHLLRYENLDNIVSDGILFDADGLGHCRPTYCLPIFYLGPEDLGLIIDRPGHAEMHRASRLFMQNYLKSSAPLQLDALMSRTDP